MEKAEFLRNKAISLGLCEEWQKRFTADTTDEDMVKMFKEGIDFCIKNRFPGAQYMKENFDKQWLNEHGIFVNQTVHGIAKCEKAEGEYVFMGTSQADVSFNNGKVATVYALDMCNLSIRVRDTSRVNVRLHHSANVDIENASINTVYVYIYRGAGYSLRERILVPPRQIKTVTAQR